VSDEIVLVIPVDKPFFGVARLVVGGLAARLDLSYDELEDIQLALESVLEHEEYAAGQDVTVRLRVEDGAIALSLGPLREPTVRAALADDRDGVGLGRLLGAVAERVELTPEGETHWLVLEKRVGAKA
jgi:hypothetical protein